MKKMSASLLSPVALAVSLASLATVAPLSASADISATVSISNMYLWRGQNISKPGPEVSGSLDYTHDSGLYAGIWMSSEGWLDNSSETDLYLGYAGEVSGFGYDISYVHYLYPGATDSVTGEKLDLSDSDLADVVVGLSYGPVSFNAYVDTGQAAGTDFGDNVYYTLAGSMDKFTLTYGMYSFDNSDSDYSHIQLGYDYNDNVSFAVSKLVENDEANSIEEDPLFQVSYSLSF